MDVVEFAKVAIRKLKRVLSSELEHTDKLRYLWHDFAERRGNTPRRFYRLRGGDCIALRPRTTDTRVFDEVFLERIYADFLRPDSLPTVLVDLGANIGLSTLFFLRRLPIEEAIAVEPDSANFGMLQENLSGKNTRCLRAFAGGARGFAEILDPGYGAWGLRIGSPAASAIPVLPLTEIVPDVPGGVLLKCDIEGGERDIFPGIRDWDRLVGFIVLELHTEYFTEADLRGALQTSRYRWTIHGTIPEGAVLAVIALERGELKSEPLQSVRDSRNHSGRAAAV